MGSSVMEVPKINIMGTKVMIIIETTEVEDKGVVAIKTNKDTGIGLRKETIIIVMGEVAKNGMTEVNMMALQGTKNMVATTSSATKNLISRQSITIQTIANTMSIVMNFSKRSFLKNQVLLTSKFTYSKVKAQNLMNLSQVTIEKMTATKNSN